MDDEWIGTREVAEMLKKPEPTIRYWRHIGYGPVGVRLGRTVMYRRGDWQAFMGDLLAQAIEARQPKAPAA